MTSISPPAGLTPREPATPRTSAPTRDDNAAAPYQRTTAETAVALAIPAGVAAIGGYGAYRAMPQLSSGLPIMGAMVTAQAGGFVGREIRNRYGDDLPAPVATAAPIALQVGGALAAYKGLKAVGPTSHAPLIGAAMAGSVGLMMGQRALKRMESNPGVTNPPDTGRSRAESVRDGAIMGAATLGVAAVGLYGARAGIGAALAGGGPARIATETARVAGPWALAAGAAGAGIGAAVGMTAREPEAVIGATRDRAIDAGISGAKLGGIAGAAVGGIAAGALSRSPVKALAGAAALGTTGALYMGGMSMSYSWTNNVGAAWANTPKR